MPILHFRCWRKLDWRDTVAGKVVAVAFLFQSQAEAKEVIEAVASTERGSRSVLDVQIE
jgi:hypothetical protein